VPLRDKLTENYCNTYISNIIILLTKIKCIVYHKKVINFVKNELKIHTNAIIPKYANMYVKKYHTNYVYSITNITNYACV